MKYIEEANADCPPLGISLLRLLSSQITGEVRNLAKPGTVRTHCLYEDVSTACLRVGGAYLGTLLATLK